MTMPGFTATASLYEGRGYYCNQAGQVPSQSRRDEVRPAQAQGSRVGQEDRAIVLGPIAKCWAWGIDPSGEGPGPLLGQASFNAEGDTCFTLSTPWDYKPWYQGPYGPVRDVNGDPLVSICREPTDIPNYYHWRKLMYNEKCEIVGSSHYGNSP
jgi:hypothetical protein